MTTFKASDMTVFERRFMYMLYEKWVGAKATSAGSRWLVDSNR